MPAPPLKSLRIAWLDDCGIPLAAEIQAALEQLASRLAAAGCRVERCAPAGFDFRAALYADGLIEQGGFQAKAALPRPLLRGLSKVVERRDPLAAGYIAGYGAALNTYTDALIQRDLAIQRLERFLSEWDAWIVPVSSTPAFPHPRALTTFEMLRLTIDVDGQPYPYFLATAGHCNPFNLTGSPVVVMPAGRTGAGLPIGIQLVGRRFQDAALLGVAERLEEVIGTFQAPPGYQG